MHEPAGTDAVDIHPDLFKPGPAERELGAEVVVGDDAGQGMDSTEGIVDEHHRERLEIRLPQRSLGRQAPGCWQAGRRSRTTCSR